MLDQLELLALQVLLVLPERLDLMVLLEQLEQLVLPAQRVLLE